MVLAKDLTALRWPLAAIGKLSGAYGVWRPSGRLRWSSGGLWKLLSACWDASGSFFVHSQAKMRLLEESAGAGFEPGTSLLIIL